MKSLRKNNWLFISLGAILLFLLTAAAYMKDSPIPYPGPWPLVLISGTVILTLTTGLIFSAINLWRYKFHWQGLATILINAITLAPICYAFLIWVILIAA